MSETEETTTAQSNITESELIIDNISSGFGAFGATICFILGTLLNLLTLVVILSSRKVKKQPLSPLLFFLSLSYLSFCVLFLPMLILRFSLRDSISEVLGGEAKKHKNCKIFVAFFYPNVTVTNWMVSLMSLSRLLALPRWNLAEEYFTWKRCGAYFMGCWIVSFIFLALPLSGVWGEVIYQPLTFSCTIDSNGPLYLYLTLGNKYYNF